MQMQGPHDSGESDSDGDDDNSNGGGSDTEVGRHTGCLLRAALLDCRPW